MTAQRASQTDSHTGRLGDLQVTVTAARVASSQDIADYGLHPRAGYNIALVFLRVKNIARYNTLRVTDNWGNNYSLRYPNADDVGNWLGAQLPLPGESESKQQYKPNESTWALRLIPMQQFVADIKELTLYVDYPKVYFKVEEPFSRRRDLLRNQPEPNPSELKLKIVTESNVVSR